MIYRHAKIYTNVYIVLRHKGMICRHAKICTNVYIDLKPFYWCRCDYLSTEIF